MERTPYLRYLKDCLQHAEDSKIFGPDTLAYRTRCLDPNLSELSQVVIIIIIIIIGVGGTMMQCRVGM
jgi:hypothetical protein